MDNLEKILKILIPVFGGLAGASFFAGERKISGIFLITFLILTLSYLILSNFNTLKKRLSAVENPKGDIINSNLKKHSEIPILQDDEEKFIANKLAHASKEYDISNIIRFLLDSSHHAFVLKGDSGVGKTTIAKFILKRVSELALKENKNIIPFLIPLRELIDNHNEIFSKYLHTILEFNPDNHKVVIVFDGVNEIDPPKLSEIIQTLNKELTVGWVYNLVFLGRPESIDDNFLAMIPLSNKISIIEIENWSHSQLISFLTHSGIDGNEVRTMKKTMIDLLSTPFFAHLYLQARIEKNHSDLNNLMDIIEVYINSWLNPKKTSSDFYQIINRNRKYAAQINKSDKRAIAEKLAYNLTLQEKLIFDIQNFSQILNISTFSQKTYETLLKEMSNHGLIQKISGDKFQFRHQIFQEYLTASYILQKQLNYPSDVSQNDFWYEVPSYHFIQATEEDKIRLLNNFKTNNEFLGLIRLATIGEKVDKNLVNYTLTKVTETFKDFDKYHLSSEVFSIADKEGQEFLLKELRKLDWGVIAPEEMFISGMNKEWINEKEWRKIGRSLQILTNNNNFELIHEILEKVSLTNSYHLNYHLLEYIYKIVHMRIRDRKIRKIIKNILELILINDPIVTSYKALILKRLDVNSRLNADSFYVRKFILDHYECDDYKYRNSFWIRNHGIELLSTILPQSLNDEESFVSLVVKLLKKEEIFLYDNGKPFYFAVHSSVVKSLIQMFDSNRRTSYEIIELLLLSKRVNENSYCLKKLAELLKKILQYKPSDAKYMSEFLTQIPKDYSTYKILNSALESKF